MSKGEEGGKVSTPCERVIESDGYIRETKYGISKFRLYIWVGQLEVRCITSHCIALPRRCG